MPKGIGYGGRKKPTKKTRSKKKGKK